MKLHGHVIAAGDAVYDMVDGLLRVVDVYPTAFAVRLKNGTFRTYDSTGLAKNRGRPTLFWHNPIVMSPHKDANMWALQRTNIVKAAKFLSVQAELTGEQQ